MFAYLKIQMKALKGKIAYYYCDHVVLPILLDAQDNDTRISNVIVAALAVAVLWMLHATKNY